MANMWKTNWEDTKRRFTNWWKRKGLVVGMWNVPVQDHPVHEDFPKPVPPASLEARYTDPDYRAAENHYRLSRAIFPLDILHTAKTEMGPGSLASILGSEPDITETSLWFNPVFEDCDEPEKLPPLRFDPENRWWRAHEAVLRRCVEMASGKYIVAVPDFIENIDILASLRGNEPLCIDLIERPGWVAQKIREINVAWFEAYKRAYDIVKQPDGGSAIGAFFAWAPGTVSKVQCDASAMFSQKIFREIVMPSLVEQCDWLDYALYHLDGTQALCHLDALLEIDGIDAIEWTPQAGIETGGNPRWYDLYKRILAGGKSVQAIDVKLDEIAPLLDAIGNEGVFFTIQIKDGADAERVHKIIEPYYK